MAHVDPKARKEVRVKVNLNHYEAKVLKALAELHHKQPSTILNPSSLIDVAISA